MKSLIPEELLKLKAYSYELPQRLIAQYPLEQRDRSRLMVVERGTGKLRHDTFGNIGNYLPKKSLVVVNNSKVIPARLLGKRQSGGAVEVFLLKPLADAGTFEVLLKPLKKIKLGEEIIFDAGLNARLIDKDKRIVQFNKPDVLPYLNKIGHVPLPPYIKRSDEPLDRKVYQTVYAKASGSVAAPTAGMHFTKELIRDLKGQGHQFAQVTLHINYGTFKPVECQDIVDHPMHTESYHVAKATYARIHKAGADNRPVVAVGTTACRVMEAAALSGAIEGQTDIFIYPGYDFKAVDVLLTNFHLPFSTLLMLVCAFGGYDLVMRAYQEAIKERYRFYSYGDAMLII